MTFSIQDSPWTERQIAVFRPYFSVFQIFNSSKQMHSDIVLCIHMHVTAKEVKNRTWAMWYT